MKTTLKRIIKNKQAKRKALANLPIARKLEMLDDLRERALSIRKAAELNKGSVVNDSPIEYKTQYEKNKRESKTLSNEVNTGSD